MNGALRNPKDSYKGFSLVNLIKIEELCCTLSEIEHKKSGAKIIHIANDDPENLFCLSFQTIPENSNGVAHILEHTVLCGSKKFPIKDPFFAMNRRSLNTFMNALTGADFTCYPAASQVKKDFYNLLTVYLDAVFFPNLTRLSFMQEGHRLEFAEPADPSSDLVRKGVVYNEMKGAMASSSTRLGELLNSLLYPDLTYGYNSGGDPKNIPELTYEQLLAFHDQFYHPSRCLFFFYGDIPVEHHLDCIEETLNAVDKLPPLPPLPKQKRYDSPQFARGSYPAREDEESSEEKTLVAIGWLTCSILEQEELLGLTILMKALADTDAAPLKMALLRSGLCKQVSCYIDSDVSEVPIVLSMKGCGENSGKALEEKVKEELLRIKNEGVPLHLIENALHQVELARCEIGGGSAPFGLSLFFRSVLPKHHGASLDVGLRVHTLFAALKKKREENPRYFEELIDSYLLSNTHRVTVELLPDKFLESKENGEEKALLDEAKKLLSEEESAAIVADSKRLSDYQKEQEEADLDVLPKVTLADVPPRGQDYLLEKDFFDSTAIYRHSCFTNGMVYADLIFRLPPIEEKQLPLLRLFSTIITGLGAGGLDYIKTLEKSQSCTAGISCSLALYSTIDNFETFTPTLAFHSHCLERNCPAMFELIKGFTEEVAFSDKLRLRELLLKQYTQLESSLNQGGMRYAINIACSGFGSSGRINKAWNGLDYFHFIKELASDVDSKLDGLIEQLENLHRSLFAKQPADLVLCCSADQYDIIKKERFYGLCDRSQPIDGALWKPCFPKEKIAEQGRVISSQVAFSAKACQTVPYSDEAAPALLLATSLMENLVLHPRIREQGGAYGAGAFLSFSTGAFYLYSYRDPQIKSSVEAFEEALEMISNGQFDEEDLEEAKLEAIQDLDTPVSPGSRAILPYGWMLQGKTAAIRQKFRQQLLNASADEIQKAATNYLLQLKNSPLVVFAGKELLEKESKKLAEPLQILAV